MTGPGEDEVAAAILTLAEARGLGRTLCPSEAAKRLADDWRPLMPQVRRVAARLQSEGVIRVTQNGWPVNPLQVRGPIRLGLAPP